MTTLASAVAIGDNQLTIDAPLTAGQVPGWVKIDSELLKVGGQNNLTGTTLVLGSPAKATHSQGATVTYAGNPFDAAFLAATAGSGGGSLTLDNTVDPPAEVTTLVSAGAVIVGDEGTLQQAQIVAEGGDDSALVRVNASGDSAETLIENISGTAQAILTVEAVGTNAWSVTDGDDPASGATINLSQSGVVTINAEELGVTRQAKLTPAGLQIDANTEVMLTSGTADPSAGAGVAATEGSLYLRTTGGAGQLWAKTGAADTDWTKITP